MLKIGQFSKLSNTSVRMIRYYEKIGLLLPDKVDLESGYRYYSARQLKDVGKIKQLQRLGFSLAMIQPLMETEDVSQIQDYLTLRKVQLTEELDRVITQTKLLDSVQSLIREDVAIMNYHVVEKEIPARKVMSIRRVVPDESYESALWNELYQESVKQNVKYEEKPLAITIYHDEEYQEKNADMEVQNSVVGEYQDTESVKFKWEPANQVASVTFQGSYDQMPVVMQAIAQWIETQNFTMHGPMFNIFHVSPAQDENPENWITEACVTIQK